MADEWVRHAGVLGAFIPQVVVNVLRTEAGQAAVTHKPSLLSGTPRLTSAQGGISACWAGGTPLGSQSFPRK